SAVLIGERVRYLEIRERRLSRIDLLRREKLHDLLNARLQPGMRNGQVVIRGYHSQRPDGEVGLDVALRDALHGYEPVGGATPCETISYQEAADRYSQCQEDGGYCRLLHLHSVFLLPLRIEGPAAGRPVTRAYRARPLSPPGRRGELPAFGRLVPGTPGRAGLEGLPRPPDGPDCPAPPVERRAALAAARARSSAFFARIAAMRSPRGTSSFCVGRAS